MKGDLGRERWCKGNKKVTERVVKGGEGSEHVENWIFQGN